jgi:hypothetical protein
MWVVFTLAKHMQCQGESMLSLGPIKRSSRPGTRSNHALVDIYRLHKGLILSKFATLIGQLCRLAHQEFPLGDAVE